MAPGHNATLVWRISGVGLSGIKSGCVARVGHLDDNRLLFDPWILCCRRNRVDAVSRALTKRWTQTEIEGVLSFNPLNGSRLREAPMANASAVRASIAGLVINRV